MKAAVYTGVKTIEFQDRPIPRADPGEVVVKIKYCGICRTDVEIYSEGLLPPGIVLGHERNRPALPFWQVGVANPDKRDWSWESAGR